MKQSNGNRMRMAGLAAIVGILAGGAAAVRAEIITSEPSNLGPLINHALNVQACDFSPDGLELYFAAWNRSGGFGRGDIWLSTRETLDSPWQEPVNLGSNVNSGGSELEPSISSDGLELYFSCWDDYILRVCTRPSKDAPWSKPAKIGPPVCSIQPAMEIGSDDAWRPDISSDGLSLYFCSTRVGGHGGTDIWMARRATTADPWTAPVNLGPNVNTGGDDVFPNISTDGLTLVFNRGFASIYAATRKSIHDDWGPAVPVGISAPSPGNFHSPTLSPDNTALYFEAVDTWGGYGKNDFWQVEFIPIVDFNADGKVNATDMAVLVANWGQNTPLCDISPLPVGDGIVDERDLWVLMESLVTPGPKATDVFCDALLDWVSPSFAQGQDVYLGTSFEAVNTADRTNPQGVLVSQGQTSATYDPPGLLELSQTYYWRVDFVTPGPVPTIYKGPVLEFTTAGLTYAIRNITATASSAQAASGPERTVDGSGLDKDGGHSTDVKAMWASLGLLPNWIQYEFDKVYPLHELWVWNFNTMVEPLAGFGAKTVKIEYSTDGTTWTPLADVPEFARGPGKAGYAADTTVSFAGVPAKFVKLTIEKNWGVAPQTGLSEVRFFCIQDRSEVVKP